MSFRKIVFAAGFLAVAGFMFNFGAHDAKALTAAEMQSLIIQLQQQIADLQKQLEATQEEPAVWCHTFNTSLRYGDSGSEVLALQTALGKDGFPVMDIEENGQGNNFFGEFTSSAVVGFQEKYKSEVLTPNGLKNGTGFVGLSTRAKLNQLYGCVSTTNNTTPEMVYPLDGQPLSYGSPNLYMFKAKPIAGATGYRFQLIQNGLVVSDNINDLSSDGEASLGPDDASYSSLKEGYVIVKISAKVGGQWGPTKTITIRLIKSASAEPSITVTSPNGGETWQIGSTQTIKWNSQNLPGSAYVSIQIMELLNEFDSNGKQSYLGIAEVSQGTNTLNDGSEVWTVPSLPSFRSLYNTTGKFVVRINGCWRDSTASEGAKCSGYDQSDAPFSIVATATPSVTVLSPNGGETWVAGKTYDITWKSTGVDKVSIELKNGEDIALNFPASQGKYSWSIPSNKSSSAEKIVIWDSSKPGSASDSDSSDGYFSIAAPTATVSCADSDGGYNIYTKGTVTGPLLTTGKQPVDYCLDYSPGTLVEYSCTKDSDFYGTAVSGLYSKSVQCSYGCKEGACVQAAGSLSMELAADNPVAQSVAILSTDVNFLRVKFTAGSAEDIKINSLKVYTYRDNGVYSARATDVSNLALYDGSTRITVKKQISNGLATFSSSDFPVSLIIPKGSSKTITVKADIPSTAAVSALQLALSGGNDLIAAGVTSGASVTAINSAMGNVMSVVSSGNITLSSASVPSVYLSVGEKEIFRFNLSVGSVEDVAVNYLKFSVKKQESSGSSITSAQLADISNFKLYNLTKNVLVASAEIAEGEAIFRNITTIADRGTTQVFALKGNVLKTNLCSLTTELLTLTAQGVTTAKAISPAGSTAAANLQGTCATQPSVTVVSPNGGEVFQQGKNNTISWKGGKNKVQIGIVKSSFDPAKDGVLGWIFTSALPDKTGTWDANSVSDLSLTTVWNVLSLYPGPFKIIAVSESASGNYCFGAQGVSISSDCNFDYSDNYFTIAAATPADCSYLSSGVLGAYLQGCGSAKYNPVFDFNKDKIINALDYSEVTAKLNDAAWCAAKKTETTSPCTATSCGYLQQGVTDHYLGSCGSTKYEPVFDLNKDKIINALDSSLISSKLNDETWCTAKKAETTSPCSTSGTLNDIENQLAAISGIISGLLEAAR